MFSRHGILNAQYVLTDIDVSGPTLILIVARSMADILNQNLITVKMGKTICKSLELKIF